MYFFFCLEDFVGSLGHFYIKLWTYHGLNLRPEKAEEQSRAYAMPSVLQSIIISRTKVYLYISL